jgi:cyclohexadienyl dehydratase
MVSRVSIVKAVSTAGIALLALTGAGSAIANDGVIRFGLTGDYPPFAERHTDGQLTGADVDLARAVARSLHRRAEFVITTWPRFLADFAADKFDIGIGGVTITPERAALGTFSVPLLTDGKRPLALCASRELYGNIADIDHPGVRVQINKGPEIDVLAHKWLRHATIVRNLDDSTLTAQLLDRKVDLWITDGVVVDRLARRSTGQLCSTMAQPLTHVEKAWLIRKNAKLIGFVNKAVAKALKDGSWRAALNVN